VPDDLVFLYCPTCAGERLAEAPPCPDGHGGDCPDRACVECGTALLFDAALTETVALNETVAQPGPGRRPDRRAGSTRARTDRSRRSRRVA
jgi:hypothetical protein